MQNPFIRLRKGQLESGKNVKNHTDVSVISRCRIFDDSTEMSRDMNHCLLTRGIDLVIMELWVLSEVGLPTKEMAFGISEDSEPCG